MAPRPPRRASAPAHAVALALGVALALAMVLALALARSPVVPPPGPTPPIDSNPVYFQQMLTPWTHSPTMDLSGPPGPGLGTAMVAALLDRESVLLSQPSPPGHPWDLRVGSLTSVDAGPPLAEALVAPSTGYTPLVTFSPQGPVVSALASDNKSFASNDRSSWRHLPHQRVSWVLASVADGPDRVGILYFDTSSHGLMLVRFRPGAEQENAPVNVLSLAQGSHPLAVAGPMRTFLVYSGATVYWFQFDWSNYGFPIEQSSFGAPVIDAMLVRVFSDAAVERVLLFGDGTIQVCINFLSQPDCVHPRHFAFPPGSSGSVRLVRPLADTPVGWIYLQDMDPPGMLWRVYIAPDDPDASTIWQRVILPGTLASDPLSLVLLVDRDARGAWALTSSSQTYLESKDFNCDGDPSIVCDGDASPAGGPPQPLGFKCAANRTLAPFIQPGTLCAGCADGTYNGFFLSAHTEPHCLPCSTAHCLQCLADQCVVCESGHLLQVDTGTGITQCLPQCESAYTEAGTVCVPASPPDSRAFAASTHRLPIDAGAIADFRLLAHTSLCPPPEGGGPPQLLNPRLPLDQQPHHYLAFVASSNLPALLQLAPGQHAPEHLSLRQPFIWPFGAKFVHAYLETRPPSPWTDDSHALASFFLCAGGSLSYGQMFCQAGTGFVANPSASTCPVEVVTQSELVGIGCQTIRPYGPDRVTVLTDAGLLLFSAGHTQPPSYVPLPEVFEHPAAFPSGLFPAGDGRASWMFLLRDGLPVLQPLDAIVQGHPQTLAPLAALPQMPGSFEPVVLPTDRTLFGGEFFLAMLTPPHRATDLVSWEVWHVPLGMRASWRTVHLPHTRQTLGPLPANPQGAFRFMGLDLRPLGEPHHPAALVLLTPQHVGLALLHCPSATANAPCWLQPARFVALGTTLPHVAPVNVVLLPAGSPAAGSPAAGASAAGPDVGLLLATGTEELLVVSVPAGGHCPPGTFGPGCTPCHERCLSCNGPLAADCTACRRSIGAFTSPDSCLDSCPEGLHERGHLCLCHDTCSSCGQVPGSDSAFHCLACGAGHALPAGASAAAACQPCHATCAECRTPGDPGSCIGCAAGHFLHQGLCLERCPAGSWGDAASQTCAPCPGPCSSCSSASDCTACAAGHFLNASHMCQPCDSSCTACTDGATCTICRPGMIFLDPDPGAPSLCGSTCPPGEYVAFTRCAACVASCALCAGGPDQCRVCAEGFRWAGPAPGPGGTGTCVACEPGCASCTSAACLSCEAGLLLTAAGACVGACPAGSFSNGESCQPCDISCAACADGQPDQCTDCGPGLELVEVAPGVGTCESGCAEGEYLQGTDCLPCDAACATCNGPTDKDCWRCVGAVLQGGDCVQACAARHVAVAGRCLPCHVSCAECMGTRSTECLPDCAPDLLALPAGQSPTRCVPACPAGHHTSAAGCAPCGAHCASCPESNDTCALCERGWLLDAPSCVTECPPSSVAQGGLCATCHATCATCYGPEPGHCLSCGGSMYLHMDGTCLGACPAGFFGQSGACLPCSAACAECLGPGSGQCSACPPGSLLHQGTCVTLCPAGYFADAGRVCRACDAECLTCSGPGRCSSCRAGLLLTGAGGCVAGCPAGWLACPPTGRCDACPGGCAACQADVQAGWGCTAWCTACDRGLVRTARTGACAGACPPGEFLAAGSADACAPCHAGCGTCFGTASHCTSCPLAEQWLDVEAGACVAGCPASELAPAELPSPGAGRPARVCLACPKHCERCAAGPDMSPCDLAPGGALACPAIDTCAQCLPGFLLLGGASCVGECPVGYFPQEDARPPGCLPCHARCKACSGPGPGDCTSVAGPSRGRLALGLGLGLGLLLLVLLLLLVVLLFLRLRRRRRAPSKARDDEDATVMNTIVELSLPGSILVSIASDFSPLNEDALGAGTQASVYAARAVGAGISDRLGCPGTVAIKQLKAERLTPTQVTLFQNEVALMWLLRDAPNVVRLYGYSEQPPAIVMERYQTDLATLLHSDVPLDQGTILDIAQQWASGLEAMHAQGIAHRDLKPGNVFASQRPDGSWTAALGDLGTSRNLNTDRSSTLVTEAPELNALTARYAAPEVLAAFQRRRPLDPELLLPADIFSAAIMLWECLNRTLPWAGMCFEEITASVLVGARPDLEGMPAGLLASFGDLLQMAWDSNAHTRPLAASLRQKAAMAALGPGG
ncbi:TKL protein kinase [Fonticula alba]|uniref:TKL protein kinase n=1 Tax=Fonticula alba TaxID=691883 RepID=A0A058Z1H2_FONAL|nr:TKL protein kinase [Fonticula alba]KCV68129.1 TKL protein kinase [Fonticula alba]|eukprot:XP_009497503.1 TKL protein kinase [Fonticula alba]